MSTWRTQIWFTRNSEFNRTSQLAATGLASHHDLDKATAAAETGNANLTIRGRPSRADA
jgi:multidrug resistance efflux pump